MSTIEVHRKVKNNVGDLYCNPSQYFDLGKVSSEELVNNKTDLTNKSLVIGGGGLIHKKFSLHIQDLINKKPTNTVIWGIGHNFGKKFEEKTKSNVYYPSWLQQCSLVGIRDYIEGHYNSYLPCVSCMHNAFNKTYNSEHDFVYFTHAYKSSYTNNKFPHMKNNVMDFNKVIDFLGRGNTVITDSYHGAYWAQLLGKNVQVLSWSVKFNHMKYSPYFIEDINSTPKHIQNSITGFLEESRELNQQFYQKFKNL